VADRRFAGLRCSELPDLAAGFVLGALEPAEMSSVRAHLAACPETHPEFEELAAALPLLLASVEPVEPSAALRGRILAAARADTTRGAAVTGGAAVRADTSEPPRSLVDLRAKRSVRARLGLGATRPQPIWAGLGIAAVLAVVVLGSWNLELQSTNQDLATYQRGVTAVLDAAAQPGSRLAVIAGSTPALDIAGLGAVRADGTVAIAMRGLAPTTGAQVYEAWIVAGTAAPIPIGSFQVGSAGSGSMTAAASAPAAGAVIALTLEPGPGATAPTLPLIASGVAQPTRG
jgi:hypothetical protein